MLPTTIVIDEAPRCVVRPTDTKDLNRFIRNGKAYLLADNPDGKISHRNADDSEAARWRNALALHKAWGGAEEEFFGTPL
jgi:Tfp pilus assembly protein PilN